MPYSKSGNPLLSLALQPRILPPESVIFGHSSTMAAVRQNVEKVKGSNVPILIQGESGTGKEIVANFLHEHSPWSNGAFVKVSCPAIPGTLLESELFGYEKGAFTGAEGSKPGRVELAHRGTLFLDEIGELDSGLQAKLLQVLQDGQFSRIGSQEDKRVEVRVVCATNRRLDREVFAGSFRRDLFYRINVVRFELEPLRRRREDIPDLVDYFLESHSAALKTKVRPLSPQVMRLFEAYDWPGNIRQLENLVKRYVILGTEEALSVDLLDQPLTSLNHGVLENGSVAGKLAAGLVDEPTNHVDSDILKGKPISLKKLTDQAVMDLERRLILKALQAHQWSRKEAARALSISYRSLLSKMRQAGLPSRNGNGGARSSPREHAAETAA